MLMKWKLIINAALLPVSSWIIAQCRKEHRQREQNKQHIFLSQVQQEAGETALSDPVQGLNRDATALGSSRNALETLDCQKQTRSPTRPKGEGQHSGCAESPQKSRPGVSRITAGRGRFWPFHPQKLQAHCQG